MNEKMASMEYQKVIDYLFDKIRSGQLIVGSKILSERDLSEEIGIGRNSTREAISILRGMGFIESRHGSGNYISADAGRSIRQILSIMLALGGISRGNVIEFRKLMEMTLCETMVEKGPEFEWGNKIRDILDEMENADVDTFVRLDLQYHMALIHAAGNPMYTMLMEPAAEVYQEIITEVAQNIDRNDRTHLISLHRGVFDSILKKDLAMLRYYVTEHYEMAECSTRKVINKNDYN